MKFLSLEQMHTFYFVVLVHAGKLEHLQTVPLEQVNTVCLEQMHALNYRSSAHHQIF